MKIIQPVARIAESIARNPWKILAIAFLLSIWAGWATVQLPIHTSRQALLPQNTDVAKRFNDFLKKFGAASDLIVAIEGLPRTELERFADDLAAKLKAEPEIAQTTARLDTDFFLKHAYLLMPKEALDQLTALAAKPLIAKGSVEEGLRRALALSKEHSPFGADVDLKTAEASLDLTAFFLEEWQRWLNADAVPAELDWKRLLSRHGAGGLADGHFSSRNGTMLFLFVKPKNPSGDFQSLGPFVEKVKTVAETLSSQLKASGKTPPTIGLTGLPAVEYEEFSNIRKDIALVILTAAALISALILLVVRSARWAILIFVPMGLGVLWSLGLALVTVGHLTIITAAFIAILFGLGADYGIFTSSKIAEERRAGKPLTAAIGAGIASSFIAVLTAGGASLLIFGALSTVDFPGFSELGIVAAKGVLMILISTWMVQPALYALLPPPLKALPVSASAKKATETTQHRGRLPTPAAAAIVMAAVGFAVFGGIKGLAIPFDYDVLSMLPGDSNAVRYQRRMMEESEYQSEVIIFTAQNMDEARRISKEAGEIKSLAQVQSLTQLFPVDAENRRNQAMAIGQAFSNSDYDNKLEELDRTGFSKTAFELLRTLLASGGDFIDEAQEQAFSAGHNNLVENLETVRTRLLAISAQLSKNSEFARHRSEDFFRALLASANSGLNILRDWRLAEPLTPAHLPDTLSDRFFAADGSMAIYAFPAKSVYEPDYLDQLITDVYRISPNATGFPTTHQAFAKSAVDSFTRGSQIALALCLLWILAATRSLLGFALAALPLLIGGGWMLGIMALGDISYNFANIVALPLVIALAVDYGVWFSYRWQELSDSSPWQITRIAGKVIGLAAGTELAGLGAITLASYRGVSSLGINITIGLLCCLAACLIVAPVIGQLLDSRRKV